LKDREMREGGKGNPEEVCYLTGQEGDPNRLGFVGTKDKGLIWRLRGKDGPEQPPEQIQA